MLLRLRSDDDVAKLQALQATADLAQIAYDRDVKQLRAQAISQAIVDNDTFNLKNARAQVEQQKAIVDKKTLRAPFAGHLGIRAVDLGQYLNAGTVVVTLQALDPIYADFFLPQQALDQVKIGQAITAHVDTYPGQTFAGKVTAINPLVDTGSRNVQVRATLSNPDRKLLPGMFATVDIDVGAPQRHITLPQTAIAYNPYGSTVYPGRAERCGAHGEADLRHHRHHTRRSGRRADRREGGRHRRHRRPDEAAQWLAGDDRQQRAAHLGCRAEANRSLTDRTMNFTDIFIRRPVLATVVSLLILVLGLRALGTLQVLQYPQTQNAIVTINTVYYGADPERGRRLHHHAVGECHRAGQRHRLHDLDQHVGRQHHHWSTCG